MLAVLTTHPIQYQVPIWQAIAADGSLPFEVWYLSDHGARRSYDQQFGKSFAWDINTLDGYPHEFLKVKRRPEVSGFGSLRLSESIAKRCRERNVKALWVNGWQTAAYWQAVWQAYSAGVPVWLRGESNDLAITPAWKRPAKRFLLSKFFRRVDQVLFIGQANRRLYQSFGVRDDQLHSAPYCVDNERFISQARESRPRRAEIRRFWKIHEDAFCILFAGKFIPKKRIFDILRAVEDSRFRELNRPVHLLFVGSGELGDELRKRCDVVFDADNRRGISADPRNFHQPKASFAGFLNQKEISRAYVAADCLVLPSDHTETWGLVANEALASGLPVIASDACGCAEDLIAPINPKFRFPLGNARAMADALVSLIGQPFAPSVLQAQVRTFSIDQTVNTAKRLYGLAEANS